MIGYMQNDINVDGGCFVGKNDSRKLPYPCMLCAICLETLEEIYSRTLEEQFACQNGISKEEAKKAVSTLPADVQAKNPWAKPLRQVQADLK